MAVVARLRAPEFGRLAPASTRSPGRADRSPGGWRSKAWSCMIADSRADPDYALTEAVEVAEQRTALGCRCCAKERVDRHDHAGADTGRAVHRAADRTGAHLCRPGGHRDGERAAARRIAGPHARPRRIARIPDRDQRRAQRHQPLDRRCATGAGHGGRNGAPALRRRCRSDLHTRGRGLPLRIGLSHWTPSIGRSGASEQLSPVAKPSPGGWCSKAESCMSRTSWPTRTTRWPENVAAGRRTILGVPLLREGSRDRHDWSRAETGRAVHRAADRAGAHLRRPGGDRDRERAAARRIAGPHARPRRIARIPDRDQRRAQGHQPLDLRCPTGARHGGRDGRPALRRR